jgi:type I restriction enzyme, R subunit
LEKGTITHSDNAIYETLIDIKRQTDDKVLKNTKLLDNESYFINLLMPIVIAEFKKVKIDLEPESARFINAYVAKEYLNEYQGVAA